MKNERVGLVLGGGGALGAAWMIGGRPAVQERMGRPLQDTDVIVGTSAGGVVAAELRHGIDPDDLIAHQAGAADPQLPAPDDFDRESGRLPPPRLRVGSVRLLATAAFEPHASPDGDGDVRRVRQALVDSAVIHDAPECGDPPCRKASRRMHDDFNHRDPGRPVGRHGEHRLDTQTLPLEAVPGQVAAGEIGHACRERRHEHLRWCHRLIRAAGTYRLIHQQPMTTNPDFIAFTAGEVDTDPIAPYGCAGQPGHCFCGIPHRHRLLGADHAATSR